MTNELQTTEEKKDLRSSNDGFMQVNSLETALKVAEVIANSSFAPANMRGKPGDIVVALQMGQELGLKPMQALQNIAVINGKPAIYGDAMIAVCRLAPNFEYIHEEYLDDKKAARCSAKRKNEPEVVREFSEEDAKKAGLWGKQGPWTQYPKRMLQMRARGFALRDAFSDVLRGIISEEEANDYKVIDYSESKKGFKKTKEQKNINLKEETIIDVNVEVVEEKPAPQMISDEQSLEIQALCLEYEFDINRIYKGYAVSSLTEIPAHLFDKIKTRIQAKKQIEAPK